MTQKRNCVLLPFRAIFGYATQSTLDTLEVSDQIIKQTASCISCSLHICTNQMQLWNF